MSSIKIKTLVLGGISTNCYILYEEKTKEAVIFDPADEEAVIMGMITELSLLPKGIFLTHGHYDHIHAAEPLKKKYQIKVYGHQEEEEVVQNPDYNRSSYWGRGFTVSLDERLSDGQIVDMAGFRMQVLHTPGHTKGSVCYYLEKEKLLFSGDTIFAASVGRTDLPTGDEGTLIHSIKEKIMTLPEDVAIFPGHGEQTTVLYEKLHNPFC